jgi:hypothetical protein
LLWEDDFRGDVSRWTWHADEGAALAPQDGALVATFTAGGQTAWATTSAPAGDLTLEIAAVQTEGAAAAYGLVLGWQDAGRYAAVLVNANGYAHAFEQSGAARADRFPFQQWPHILAGADGNRVRVDVRGAAATARINDERLATFSAPAPGQIGVMAQSTGPGRVVFGWVKVWAAEPPGQRRPRKRKRPGSAPGRLASWGRSGLSSSGTGCSGNSPAR